ncbi:acyltransferase family protein [Undibacterium sp. TJN19]|uniref:acyltransferase family protein n=1 Tax=Undibacterium sp. TJN19 TaxID=3413055 RepID=UPI003BF2C968
MLTSKTRLLSLDAFRGFTIAAMFLVNNPGDWGSLYPQLEHAAWSGWTFTDCIFPFFLFIVGVSLHLSLHRKVLADHSETQLLLQLLKRALWIFLIGLALNLIPNFDFQSVRIPGVLQRIALCTALAAPLVVYSSWRGQLLVIMALLAIYSFIMLAVQVPDVEGNLVAAALEPGRDAGAYIDRSVFGNHLWKQSRTWDPEGLLSTLPAVCSVLFGVLTGHWLSAKRDIAEKTVWLFIAGLACLAIGQILASWLMPVNKSLWTPSFAVFMTGWALIVFACFYWLLDASPAIHLKNRMIYLMHPFIMYGMNALFLFTLSGLIAKMLGFIHLPQTDGSQPSLHALLYAPIKALPVSAVNASLLFALLFNLTMLIIAWGMWKKRWFVKV